MRAIQILFVLVAVVRGLAAGDVDCPLEKPTLYLERPGKKSGMVEVVHYVGEPQQLEVTAWIHTSYGVGHRGVDGYVLSVQHDRSVLQLASITTGGTDGETYLPDLFHFERIIDDASGAGFVCGRVATTGGDSILPPSGDFSLARSVYEILDPDVIIPLPYVTITTIEYRDGLRSEPAEPAQLIQNNVTVDGATVVSCFKSLAVQVKNISTQEFIRGDANFDGKVDISDALVILHALFVGDAHIACEDAADVDDEGDIRITDAIYLLSYLYRGGPPPRVPFPQAGYDPCADALSCRP